MGWRRSGGREMGWRRSGRKGEGVEEGVEEGRGWSGKGVEGVRFTVNHSHNYFPLVQLVQRELRSHDGTLEAVRNLAVKLVQGVGGGHVNANGVHANLDSMGKRWKHLQRLAVER